MADKKSKGKKSKTKKKAAEAQTLALPDPPPDDWGVTEYVDCTVSTVSPDPTPVVDVSPPLEKVKISVGKVSVPVAYYGVWVGVLEDTPGNTAFQLVASSDLRHLYVQDRIFVYAKTAEAEDSDRGCLSLREHAPDPSHSHALRDFCLKVRVKYLPEWIVVW